MSDQRSSDNTEPNQEREDKTHITILQVHLNDNKNKPRTRRVKT